MNLGAMSEQARECFDGLDTQGIINAELELYAKVRKRPICAGEALDLKRICRDVFSWAWMQCEFKHGIVK